MLKKILDSFLKNNDLDLVVENVSKVNNYYNNFLSKMFLLFVFWFTLLAFIFCLMALIAAITFFFLDKIPEINENYIMVGGVIAATASYVFYKLMKKIWFKLRKPLEKKLKLEL